MLNQYINVPHATTADYIITLPSGQKNVKFVKEDIPGVATISEIEALNGTLEAKVKYYNSRKILVVGDSISAGAWATKCSTKSWIGLIRFRNPNISFIVDAVSGMRASVYRSTKLANACTNVTNLGINEIWIELGTNGDTSFVSDYTAIVDAFITANPSAYIYLQTPILTTNEPAMEVTRQQIRDIAATRPTCHIVEGNDMCGLPEYFADASHPNDIGHGVYADNAAFVMNAHINGII